MAEFADSPDPETVRRRSVATTDDTSVVTDDSRFGEALRDLKRRGCSLLVTGEVPFETRAAMSRRLFGTPDERRYRLLGVTNTVGLPVDRYLPSGVAPAGDDVTVVDFADELRGATASESPTSATPRPTVRTDDVDRLATLRTSMTSAIDRIGDRVGPFVAGELRVGVASLRGPFEDGGDHARATIEHLVEDVVGHRGMVHCHLLGGTAAVADLTDAFDVRIELRDRGTGVPEHRWVVPDRSVQTQWVAL
ncbi:DUF7504 family protein [Halomarina rubra]|uniref:Uncharacterized protein n=1 Tax=Halomarina rubra TaxID=2071873 RepID=A0ABD6ASP8_9EURY|nr:hypothetical protein [Halomarina rubra]